MKQKKTIRLMTKSKSKKLVKTKIEEIKMLKPIQNKIKT